MYRQCGYCVAKVLRITNTKTTCKKKLSGRQSMKLSKNATICLCSTSAVVWEQNN